MLSLLFSLVLIIVATSVTNLSSINLTDNEKRLLYAPDSDDETDKSSDGINLTKESGVSLDKESGIDLIKESGIDLDKESGIDLGKESGIDLGKESGIDLEQKLDEISETLTLDDVIADSDLENIYDSTMQNDAVNLVNEIYNS